jgi:hypothetical protein
MLAAALLRRALAFDRRLLIGNSCVICKDRLWDF